MNSSDKEIKNYTLIRTPELLIGKRRNLPSHSFFVQQKRACL